jgi:hypothetical protein
MADVTTGGDKSVALARGCGAVADGGGAVAGLGG